MIAQQAFGRTGHLSTRVLLGGAAFGQVTQAETDAALELALSLGVNHVDVAASYGEAGGNPCRRLDQPSRQAFLPGHEDG